MEPKQYYVVSRLVRFHCILRFHCIYIQWNLTNLDTIGLEKCPDYGGVFISGVKKYTNMVLKEECLEMYFYFRVSWVPLHFFLTTCKNRNNNYYSVLTGLCFPVPSLLIRSCTISC